MCTVSWIVRDQDYRLYFNRDEQRSRARAEVPQIQSRNGLKLIAPHDGPGGGSWIAVNQMGVTSFLLNNYGATEEDCGGENICSRGALPILMASQSGIVRAEEAFRKLDLSLFRPFYLGVIDPLGGLWVSSWNGVEVRKVIPQDPMLTTSSYRSREVEAYRRRRYLEVCGKKGCGWSSDQSLSFHRDLSHEDPAFNPLMSRVDAETHCISVVEVDSNRVVFSYYENLSENVFMDPVEVCSFKRKDEAP